MAKTERDGSPKGHSISIAIGDDGEAVLIEGSIKALAIKHGDLVLVRLASDRYHERENYQQVITLVENMMASTGRRAVAMIVPADFDLEHISSSDASELLEALVEKAEASG